MNCIQFIPISLLNNTAIFLACIFLICYACASIVLFKIENGINSNTILKRNILLIFCFLLNILLSFSVNAQVYIFVSHSMNDAALQSYYKEAESIGSILVVRGLINDSFINTKAKLDELEIGYDIDPNLFEKYEVEVVPTIIRDTGEKQQKIVGHIPLSEAIRIFDEEKLP